MSCKRFPVHVNTFDLKYNLVYLDDFQFSSLTILKIGSPKNGSTQSQRIKSPASQMYACLHTSTIGVAEWLDFILNLQNDLLG